MHAADWFELLYYHRHGWPHMKSVMSERVAGSLRDRSFLIKSAALEQAYQDVDKALMRQKDTGSLRNALTNVIVFKQYPKWLVEDKSVYDDTKTESENARRVK